MDLEEVVCFCQSVTKGMIKDAIEKGASTVEDVQKATGAGTVCGNCIDDIRDLVDEFVAERAQSA